MGEIVAVKTTASPSRLTAASRPVQADGPKLAAGEWAKAAGLATGARLS
jgi:hypothetical protein